MAATLAQSHALAINATFINRVQAAMLRRAMTLLNTTLTSDQLTLGRSILYDPAAYAADIAQGVVTETAIIARDGVETAVTDTEVINAVNAVLARYVR
jgi:hypothetical protein